MRLLHTSDWHLGLSTGPFSRLEDHRRFLDWLIAVLDEEKVDVLVVAGDVFDTMQPSAEALSAYYGFLSNLGDTGVRDVVIVGGNHDSPSRLDAPKELLQGLGIHVAGGVRSWGEEHPGLVVPLRARGSDDVSAVCLAVPYIHEYRLGIRTTDQDRETTRATFERRFEALYSDLCDVAVARFPDVPVVATGHLTMGPVDPDDYPQEIHQVGFIDGLPPSILDERLRYVALGHIHRAFAVQRDRIWYSGSPVPASTTESATPRQVLMVDLDDRGTASVRPLPVPISREVLLLEGTQTEVTGRLSGLEWDTPLPPLVRVTVTLDAPAPGLRPSIFAALEAFGTEARPLLVEVQTRFVGFDEPQQRDVPLKLADLTPAQVFGRLCEARGLGDVAVLENAFDQLVSATDDDFAQMVEDAGPTGADP